MYGFKGAWFNKVDEGLTSSPLVFKKMKMDKYKFIVTANQRILKGGTTSYSKATSHIKKALINRECGQPLKVSIQPQIQWEL